MEKSRQELDKEFNRIAKEIDEYDRKELFTSESKVLEEILLNKKCKVSIEGTGNDEFQIQARIDLKNVSTVFKKGLIKLLVDERKRMNK